MDYIIRDINEQVWHACKLRALTARLTMKEVLHDFLAQYADTNPRRLRDLTAEIARAEHAAHSEVTK